MGRGEQLFAVEYGIEKYFRKVRCNTVKHAESAIR